ncbi:preprotein translocase subunit SecY [Mycoplasma sp. E35C]|uniref:preprotein translocase subunit SecY n=1 Tax=Mycoplasma sp. E35C TaxID=2801918 RepID=UPI001CA45752|nr:preprotein translocase subunit SecY [Mycoplasma sp. E35C]QZX49205.1 preprotein translocase subunit SecY [Mycoplasma sp. E35C]
MAKTNSKNLLGQKIIKLCKNRDFVISVFVTLFLILLFRVISVIPLPGITIQQHDNANAGVSDFFDLFNLLGGGGLSQLSLFAVGISPYISAQIIMQLLSTDLIPPLSKLAKTGELGRRRIELITRFVTLPFAVIQAFAIIALINNQQNGQIKFDNNDALHQAFYIITMTAGTYISIFIGDIISKKGVGNGITLLILSGILARLPDGFIVMYRVLGGVIITSTPMLTAAINFSLYFIAFLVLLLAVTFVNSSTRKIPIQQTGEGMILDSEKLPFLPIKLNAAGVIPVIFASSIMSIPITIAEFQPQSEGRWFVEDYLSLRTPVGISIYVLLIIIFTFFYSYIQINPEQIAQNFNKSHKFIPGVRPGIDTEKHITKVLMRINFIGAPFLAIIAVIPYIISLLLHVPTTLSLGGTGIIIMVSASMELYRSLRSAATTTSYQRLRKDIANRIETELSLNDYANKPNQQHDQYGLNMQEDKTNAQKKEKDDSLEVSQLW